LVLYFLSKENKPKRRKRKKTTASKAPRRRIATKRMPQKGVSTSLSIRSISDMPVKYQKGCKGKKGKELGKCLQYWRKYRKTHPLKK